MTDIQLRLIVFDTVEQCGWFVTLITLLVLGTTVDSSYSQFLLVGATILGFLMIIGLNPTQVKKKLESINKSEKK